MILISNLILISKNEMGKKSWICRRESEEVLDSGGVSLNLQLSDIRKILPQK